LHANRDFSTRKGGKAKNISFFAAAANRDFSTRKGGKAKAFLSSPPTQIETLAQEKGELGRDSPMFKNYS
jgi:homoaconitase/3-isopropylmalate dehydratase large subunit